jgi:6-phosphogluconolactonase
MSKMHFFSWDDRRDIAHPGNNQKTLTFSIEHFINCGKEALKMHGHFAVALSGGSTPKAIFQALPQAPYSSAIDWSKAYIFWSDERSVAPTDPDSNFRMAIDAGFKNLPIPNDHFFRMKAEDNIEENALNYEMKIKQILGSRPLDLIMLGMGEDGHTASLFPGTKALEEKNRWVVANHIPQKETWRMTMTYPLINKAKNIVIYVLGKSKRDMVHKVFLEDHKPPFPVSLIGTPTNKALWILDTDACGDLHKKQK